MNTYQSSRDRSLVWTRLNHPATLQRYRRCYGLGIDVTSEHVRRHVELEAELTDGLLAAVPSQRAEAFFHAYERLYSELPWLANTGTHTGVEDWNKLLKPNADVYEVGSGAGWLVNALSQHGHRCTATELSADRQAVASEAAPGVRWIQTDGVNLTQYSALGSFDHVLSNQVIEHMHPDDIVTHLKEARALLRPGGQYIVQTPNVFHGPADLSLVFGARSSLFLHLHEYSFRELVRLASEAGFVQASAVLKVPRLGVLKGAVPGYLSYLLVVERTLARWIGGHRRSDALRILAKGLLFPSNVWLVLDR